MFTERYHPQKVENKVGRPIPLAQGVLVKPLNTHSRPPVSGDKPTTLGLVHRDGNRIDSSKYSLRSQHNTDNTTQTEVTCSSSSLSVSTSRSQPAPHTRGNVEPFQGPPSVRRDYSARHDSYRFHTHTFATLSGVRSLTARISFSQTTLR